MSDLDEVLGSGIGSDLIGTLKHRAPKVATALAVAQMITPIAKNRWDRRKEVTEYTVAIEEDDDIYDDVNEWVQGQLPVKDRRSLLAWTERGDMRRASSPFDQEGPTQRVRLRYDGNREHHLNLRGHRVAIQITHPDGAAARNAEAYSIPKLIFTTSSLEGQQIVIEEIEKVAQKGRDTVRRPRFRMLAKYGDWQSMDELPQRDLESVILPPGQLERLIADTQKFFDAEDDYLRRCIPYHRGYLFEGPPGTGKTSVARALASHFGMDIWYLPLADLDKDANLINAISRLTPRSMLLLEDVDVFHSMTDRQEGEDKVTLSGLLNALDGIATPHGILTVMTTNDVTKLDSAIRRPGRVDLCEHFALADADQVSRLLTRWYDLPIVVDEIEPISPAQVVEICKRHEHAVGAMAELRDAPREWEEQLGSIRPMTSLIGHKE